MICNAMHSQGKRLTKRSMQCAKIQYLIMYYSVEWSVLLKCQCLYLRDVRSKSTRSEFMILACDITYLLCSYSTKKGRQTVLLPKSTKNLQSIHQKLYRAYLKTSESADSKTGTLVYWLLCEVTCVFLFFTSTSTFGISAFSLYKSMYSLCIWQIWQAHVAQFTARRLKVLHCDVHNKSEFIFSGCTQRYFNKRCMHWLLCLPWHSIIHCMSV